MDASTSPNGALSVKAEISGSVSLKRERTPTLEANFSADENAIAVTKIDTEPSHPTSLVGPSFIPLTTVRLETRPYRPVRYNFDDTLAPGMTESKDDVVGSTEANVLELQDFRMDVEAPHNTTASTSPDPETELNLPDASATETSRQKPDLFKVETEPSHPTSLVGPSFIPLTSICIEARPSRPVRYNFDDTLAPGMTEPQADETEPSTETPRDPTPDMEPPQDTFGDPEYSSNSPLSSVASNWAPPPEISQSLVRVKDEIQEVTLNMSPPPRKRRRLVFDCVELPSLSMVNRIKVKLEEFSNPDIRIKLEGLESTSLFRRLADDTVFPINLPQDVFNKSFKRAFISTKYGGNLQHTFPEPGKQWHCVHSIRRWMMLPLYLHPDAPKLPGSPGLYLNTAPAGGEHRHVERLHVMTGDRRWLYMGMYRLFPEASLTAEEWCKQPKRFKQAWAHHIFKMGWGDDVCARVKLRKRLGRSPSLKEVNEVLANNTYREGVTTEDIIRDFEKGEEHLGVWKLKCVAYDEAYQQDLIRKSLDWTARPVPPRKPTSRKPKENGTTTTPTKAKQAKKLKWIAPTDPYSNYLPDNVEYYQD